AHFKNQLRELLTGYGKVGEVWFDGAGSEGHVYDWDGYYALIRELQPQALIAICGPDIRWVGNEQGYAPETLWNVQERDGGKVWYPAECDVPIRKGQWFWHPNSEGNVKSLEELLDIYYGSVGRGAVLLLNVTPDDTGQLPEADVVRLRELWVVISDTFDENLAAGQPATASNVRGGDARFGADKAVDGNADTYWSADDDVTTATLEVDLGAPVSFNRLMMQEAIALGQRIEAYHVEVYVDGAWQEIVSGTTIGHKRLERIEPIAASKVRFVVDQALACPAITQFGVYLAEKE
ncbi:MAG: discoidin domain-containing protein, partial [Candidatus Hydrogenedentes bacterium]|nr:discoidin domain-containing protein [Candidatus Hydrogenedentota bacterium]